MQIVIDISDYDAEWINNAHCIPEEISIKIADAIIEGTPLPKGHGDLIDRGETVKRICKVAEFMNEKRENLGGPYIMAALFIQDNKEEFPTIIEADKETE